MVYVNKSLVLTAIIDLVNETGHVYRSSMKQSNFQLSKETKSPLHLVSTLCLWYKKLTPFSQLIVFKTQTDYDMVTVISSHFRQFSLFHSTYLWLNVII